MPVVIFVASNAGTHAPAIKTGGYFYIRNSDGLILCDQNREIIEFMTAIDAASYAANHAEDLGATCIDWMPRTKLDS